MIVTRCPLPGILTMSVVSGKLLDTQGRRERVHASSSPSLVSSSTIPEYGVYAPIGDGARPHHHGCSPLPQPTSQQTIHPTPYQAGDIKVVER
jgi:hypothetical protein